MNSKNLKNRLTEMTGGISESLNAAGTTADGGYEYSAAYAEPKGPRLTGLWRVIEHMVGDMPYARVFAAKAFPDIEPEYINYEATYEFHKSLCIKRISISGEVETDEQSTKIEYHLTMTLFWELKGDIFSLKPLIGYQYSCIDGKPTEVRELPPETEWIKTQVSFEDGNMILQNDNDVKILQRADT